MAKRQVQRLYFESTKKKPLYRKSIKMFLVTILRQLNQLTCRECISFKKRTYLVSDFEQSQEKFCYLCDKAFFCSFKL